ncbi:MAG TPA: MFS transporter [Acetobacteraceae bacterium]|nr:MFS transporter [Acetobacteraceae bacterium]
MDRPIIDVASLIETQRFGRFAMGLLGWTFLCMLLDGFDFAAISFVVPALAREWHVPVGSFGSVFGFGVAGLMVGSIVFGWVGDRIGRRTTIILGCWLFGGFTLASIWAPSVSVLLWLRFLAGVGLYAAVPNAIVLVSEFAPRRLRATWVVLMFTGFTIGAVLAGIGGATLIPNFGWQAMFLVGGVLPFVISICLWFALPDSVRFLTLREHRWGELRRVIGRMLPGYRVPDDARFVIHEDTRGANFSPRLLFVGNLLFITPLLWLFYIFNSAAVFFMQSWMPVLIHGVGLSESNAALTTSVYSLGGTIGGLVTGQIIDRLGLSAVAVLPFAGAIVGTMVGVPMPVVLLEMLVFGLGFFVVGAQFACTAMAPVFYPTAYRANAEGWALAVAKIGSIAGPVIGGVLLGLHLPGYQLFYVAAIPLLLSAAFAFALGRVARGHLSEAALATERA